MYLTSTDNNGKTWRTAQKLGGGTWKLSACPMDGGGLGVSANGTVQTVWRRENDLFTSAPGKTEQFVGRGQQGWAAQTHGGMAFAYLANGRPGNLCVVLPINAESVTLAAKANDPVLAISANGTGPVIAAWTQTEPAEQTVICAAMLSNEAKGGNR